ncbi:DUF1236 domain-containing protein [Sagittula sp. NFXS13]|uniref:Uncharacterized protein YraI n=1 Tax=Sagittula marina TaxID=943940 RepID=A0A7W6GTK3_9RHOB|nr:DUF1236 domain-containing protein [Sagittula marina]MBB3987631.1 uncharacterized protein YraI [Sagittula marina]
MYKNLTLATALTAVSAMPLMAAVTAATTTELNLRAAPGPQAEVVAVMPQDATVDIAGCTSTDWCKVSFDGTEGWAYSPYLINTTMPEPTVIYQNTGTMEIETIEVDNNAADATAGAAIGAGAAALLVGGPAAVAAGAILGAAGGAAAPADETVTYVTQNPVEPVYLNGEAVVGAGLPQEVEIYTVPESEYSYAYINDAPVLVNPEDRRIVYVVR